LYARNVAAGAKLDRTLADFDRIQTRVAEEFCPMIKLAIGLLFEAARHQLLRLRFSVSRGVTGMNETASLRNQPVSTGLIAVAPS